ncbi:MAG: undecaprenyl-diphosphatase UppP [Bacilli bacterium]|nr:undecaprenyl-diphosphatase UppP [Bacilli bacterium]
MDILSVIILGIVQGIAEFLPISSSAHLIIFRDIFGIGSNISDNIAMSFDIALHLGTLLAILVFFYKDFIKIITNGLTKGVKDKDGKLLWYLIAATIPAALAGVLFEDVVEDFFRNSYYLIAIALAFMGIVIYLCDIKSEEKKDIHKLTLKDSLIIGTSQILALIPGFSRSGTTIAAARTLGVDRTSSAKFSFYLSAPIVAGAVVLELLHKSTWTMIGANLSYFAVGILTSFIIGLLCIKFLLKYLDNHNFKIFMIYRIILAIIVIIILLGGK